MQFSIQDFSNKCYQIRSLLRIWSYLLKKFFVENFILFSEYYNSQIAFFFLQ